MSQDTEQFKQQIRSVLAERPRAVIKDPALICAAVLVPVLCRKNDWHVLVTQRTQTVGHHKGQISFPGGACEPGDANLLATALREAHEEIGVPPEAVEILGALDDMVTITNFSVTPYVGVIPHPFDYRLHAGEVQAAIEVPLSFLCNPSHLRVEQMHHDGRVHDVLFWDYGPYTIWGATARMLKGFLELACDKD